MCQAIVKPAGVSISKAILKRAWQSNADGAGFAYVSDSRDAVVIEKGFFRFKNFYKAYRVHQDKDLIVHFRWATHGSRTKENCHPFQLSPDAALIHNGILSQFQPLLGSTMSDTRTFCEHTLVPAMKWSDIETAHEYFSSPALKSFIESLIGGGNKLAILTLGGFVIFNECLGEWVGGAWYSAGFPSEDFMVWPAGAWVGNSCSTTAAATSAGQAYSHRLDGEHTDPWEDAVYKRLEEDEDKAMDRALRSAIERSEDEAEGDYEDEEECEAYEDEEVEARVRSANSCDLCFRSQSRLYTLDGRQVCGVCWHDLATANTGLA